MSKKTETTTFRIEKEILDGLRKSAKTEKITLNAFINQSLSQLAEWYLPAKKAGFVPLPKVLLVKIMKNLTNDQVVQIAEYMVKKEIKDIMLVLKNQHNLAAFLGVVESWAISSAFPFSHEEISSSTHNYVINHDMGKKWSLYFGEVFKRMFVELGVSEVTFDVTEKTLVFNFTYADFS